MPALTPDQVVQTAKKQVTTFRTHPTLGPALTQHATGVYLCIVEAKSRLRLRETAVEAFDTPMRQDEARNACIAIAQALAQYPHMTTSKQIIPQPNLPAPFAAVRGLDYVIAIAGDPSKDFSEIRALTLSVVIGDTTRGTMEAYLQQYPNQYITGGQVTDDYLDLDV